MDTVFLVIDLIFFTIISGYVIYKYVTDTLEFPYDPLWAAIAVSYGLDAIARMLD